MGWRPCVRRNSTPRFCPSPCGTVRRATARAAGHRDRLRARPDVRLKSSTSLRCTCGAMPISVGAHTSPSEEPAPPSGFDARVVGLLFADVAGFSKLTEEQIPPFVREYLGKVGEVLSSSDEQPLLANTWGDGLYFVFAGVGETGRFALRLSEGLHAVDWTQFGLPGTLPLRIAVHAGPVYPHRSGDRTAELPRCACRTGRADRTDHPTWSGVWERCVRCVGEVTPGRGFRVHHVGQTPLAKGFGTFPFSCCIRARSASLAGSVLQRHSGAERSVARPVAFRSAPRTVRSFSVDKLSARVINCRLSGRRRGPAGENRQSGILDRRDNDACAITRLKRQSG